MSVRSHPKRTTYATLETEGDLPDTTAIIQTLMLHRDLIMSNQMIYLIVDNRTPTDVPHWPAFAAWWASRRCLVGPQEEATDILWVCADATTGLHKVPYYWAGVFVLEAARFLYPAQHFALIDNDCVPVTLFEVQDLLQLAHQQHQWVDLIGCVRSESSSCAGIGMLLFTEAHLEYNAGLVISIGNRSKHSPLEYDTTASTLAKNLQAGRLALVSRARPPVNPSDTAIGGTLFTPFVGIAMQTALDLCMVWSLYGLYMRKHFWPSPVTSPDELGPGGTIKWPRQSHPKAPDVLSVSDRDTEKEEHEVQEGQPLSSLAATDATMADEEANEAVSVHSSSSESPTIPSTEQPEEDDAHMEDDDSANTSSADEDDCLSNRPAPPEACPAQDEMLEAEDEARSVRPPQDVEPPSSSPTSHFSESPIKRRPGSKASAGRAQSKKLRKSLAPTSRQPLGGIPEHEQPPATLADLASRNAQRQEAPVCRNPETPPDNPGSTQERPHTMTEIDIASDQEHAERGGTAATDLQLESEQRAMQALYDYQNAARTARKADGQRVPLPSLQIYSDLPRMADGEACNFQQAN